MRCLDKDSFVGEFGAVYEHSPWVARQVFDRAMEECLDTTTLDADTLAARFESAFLNAPATAQLEVLCAHPQLACARAECGDLTADSRREQSSAGLDQCSDTDFSLFREMNAKYIDKYSFPFIIAVKDRNRQQILEAFRSRLENDTATEFQTALRQVCQIARFRIGDIVDG